MKATKFLAALGVAAGMLMSAAPSHAVDFRVLVSWDETYPTHGVLLKKWAKDIETASKGDMKFTISGPETVPPFEQLQPVGAGAFQFLVTHSAYHVGITPYLLPLDGIKGDPKIWRSTGLYDMVDKHYQKFGLKLVALAGTPPASALQVILRQPVSANGDLAGRKLRGTQTYAGVFSMLGASPVVLSAAETYPALEKGIIDGAGWPTVGIVGLRFHEVAKFQLQPRFGMLLYPVFANLAAWNKLTPEQQKIILDEGPVIEEFFMAEWPKLTQKEDDELKAKGVAQTVMADKFKPQLGEAFERALWQIAAEKDAKSIGELRDFVVKNKLSYIQN